MADHLFIGGDYDGKHISVPEGADTWHLTYKETYAGGVESFFRTNRYRREKIALQVGHIDVFVFFAFTTDEAMKHLVDNYRGMNGK